MGQFDFKKHAKSMARDIEYFNENLDIFSRLNKTEDPEERQQLVDFLEKNGFIAPRKDNVFVELGQGLVQSGIESLAGTGATLNELGFGDAMQNYFQGVLENNQQWNRSPHSDWLTTGARWLGEGTGSTLGTLVATTGGTLVGGPKVGATLGVASAFTQTFGDTVQRNRGAGYGEEKAYGMAFLESTINALYENLPFSIVGKGGKLVANAGRLNRISAAGKRELLNRIGQRMAAQVGQKEAKNLLYKYGVNILKGGAGEAAEEDLQMLTSFVMQKLGGDPNAEITVDQFVDATAQALLTGGAFESVTGLSGIRREAKMRKSAGNIESNPETVDQNVPIQSPGTPSVTNAAESIQPGADAVTAPEAASAEIEQPAGEVSEAVNNDQPLFDTLITDVGNALGINIDFMDSRPDGTELEKEKNGIYDKNNKTLYLNRNTYSVNPAETLGHELKHYIDDNIPELSKAFNDLLEAGKTEAGKQEVAEIAKEFDITEAEGNVEFSADIFGKLFARPETWQKMATQLDERTPGMGEKFLQTLRDFYALVKNKLVDLVGTNPEAETFLNNVADLESEAARMLAELRRRNGNSTQVENVVGAKGNTAVETVPVSQINVDAKRFQFKSNTSKTSGVDESNKLGGDWDARTAGNLYLWEDKNGKLYVVNGHHRLELAQRNGVENVNAIIDREADGVTAEQARRNGVLINIRDGQGEVRDYASFVRSEKLSEDEAKAQGVTARQKGRAGFLLGNAGDTLYDAYINEVIPESKAVIIAEVANGNEAVEYAGIKLATDRKLAGETLRQTLKLAAQNTSGTKVESEQGSLFDTVDDSVLQEWEAIGKVAAKHIKEIRTRIEAAKDAIKNPEAAKSLGVKTSKGAEKLLSQAQQELARWENYATDSELMAQLRGEAGIAPQEAVSEPGKTTPAEVKEEVVGAENAQTTPAATPKENLEVEETTQPKSAYKNLKDRSAEIGFTFDQFYEKYAPQLDAIIAKASNQFRTLGDEITDDWRSAAYEAMAKAYMKYDPKSGVKISTYATKAVVNAINEVNRKHKAETIARGGRVSLDQTNEQGEALHEAVADENAAAVKSKENKNLEDDYRKWKATLKPKDQRILTLSESGLSPSEIGRAAGIGMSTQAVHTRLKELAIAARTDGELMFSRKRGQSIQKRDATLTEVAKLNMRNEVSRVIETGIPEGKYVFKNLDDKQKTIDGAIKFLKEFSRKIVPLSDGRIAYFMPDERAFERGSATAWAEYGIHAVTSSGKQIPGKEYNERLFNQNKLDNLDRIIPIIQQENVFGKFDNKNPAKDGVIFVGTSHDGKRLEVITRLDEYGNPQADLTEVTVLATNKESNIPPHKPLSEVVEAVAQHQAAGFSPSTNNNIPQSGEKSSADLEFSRKRLHQQINPIVRDGKVRDKYADLLANKKYTPTTLKELQDKAFEWILARGGIIKAAKDILDNKAPADSAVAEIARRYILNSDVFADNMSFDDRVKLNTLEMDERSKAGLTLRSMRLDSLNLKDVASVQALLNKLHKDMPSEDLQKLRNQIQKDLDIDIFKLPKDIVDDKSKLDAVLRAHLAHKANFGSKLYEYWINAILSGPTTHITNLLGNTVNAVYELGIKRFTESLVNIAAGRKDGATFGEFREMLKAWNWSNAWKAAKQAFDLEVLDPSGKYLENISTAIGGKTGRTIRVPGRLLKAADAFAKALIQPMETAAYAYRMGVSEGLSGTKLQEYIQNQLANKDSKAYQWAKERAKELTFQEDLPDGIARLAALRESPGALGIIVRFTLPFIKTPYNILGQGLRKGPLGGLNLLIQTGKALAGKGKFDGQYIGLLAEQLLAWGTFMAIYSMSDDDDLPFITGASAAYGSAEYGFKANKLPPYSIRIGDTWFSYQRIEPLATALAAMADGIHAIHSVKNGKDGTKAISELFSKTIKTVSEKSFIDSIGETAKMVEDPDKNLFRPVNNLLASAMPNVFRQISYSLKSEVMDNKSREKGLDFLKDQFFIVTNSAGITTALPKIDYFGRKVNKDAFGDHPLSPIGRMFPIKVQSGTSDMDQAERLIWNYNQKNPNAEYYPSIPQNTFTVNKQKYYLSGENYTNYAIDAGQLAHKQINNAIKAGRLNVKNPGPEDIKLIKEIFTRARKETKEKYFKRAKKF